MIGDREIFRRIAQECSGIWADTEWHGTKLGDISFLA